MLALSLFFPLVCTSCCRQMAKQHRCLRFMSDKLIGCNDSPRDGWKSIKPCDLSVRLGCYDTHVSRRRLRLVLTRHLQSVQRWKHGRKKIGFTAGGPDAVLLIERIVWWVELWIRRREGSRSWVTSIRASCQIPRMDVFIFAMKSKCALFFR